MGRRRTSRSEPGRREEKGLSNLLGKSDGKREASVFLVEMGWMDRRKGKIGSTSRYADHTFV